MKVKEERVEEREREGEREGEGEGVGEVIQNIWYFKGLSQKPLFIDFWHNDCFVQIRLLCQNILYIWHFRKKEI